MKTVEVNVFLAVSASSGQHAKAERLFQQLINVKRGKLT